MLLNTADKVYAGVGVADRVYLGSTLVWEPDGGGSTDPTVPYWFSSEGATVGASVSASDTFGVPWSQAVACVYSDVARNGERAIAPTPGAANGPLQWDAVASTKAAVGFWVKFKSLSVAEIRLFDLRQTSTAGTVGGLYLYGPSAQVRLMVGSAAGTGGQSPAIVAGQWYWMTLFWDATAKTAQFKIYTDATTLFHDSGVLSVSASTFANFGTVRFVRPASSTIDADYDDFQFDPTASATIAPWISSGTTPPSTGRPDASNTGSSGTLTAASGTVNLDVGGAIYENRDLAGMIQVRATSGGAITIRNCTIRGLSGGVALIDMGRAGIVPTIIEDCTFIVDYPSNNFNAVVGHDFTMRRCNISRSVDGISAWNLTNSGGPLNVVVEDNYVHHLHVQSPDPNQTDDRTHNDGVQVHTGGGIIIRRNNFELGEPSPTSTPGGLPIISCLMLNGTSGKPNADIVIEDNWFQGGTSLINGGDPNPGPRTIYCDRNVFHNTDGAADIIVTRAADTWIASGNTDQNGNPVAP